MHSLFSSHRHTLSVKISCLFSITNHDLCQSCNIRNITLYAYFNIRIHVLCKYDVFKARIKSSICEFQRKSINSTSTNLAFHKFLKLLFCIFSQSNKFHLKINICQEVVWFKCTRTNIKPKYDKLTNGTTGHYTLEQKVKLGLLINISGIILSYMRFWDVHIQPMWSPSVSSYPCNSLDKTPETVYIHCFFRCSTWHRLFSV